MRPRKNDQLDPHQWTAKVGIVETNITRPPTGSRVGHSLSEENQIPWELLAGPGAPKTQRRRCLGKLAVESREQRLQVLGRTADACLAGGQFPARSGCSWLPRFRELTPCSTLLPLPNGRLSNELGNTGQDRAWSPYFLSGAQY